MKQSQSSVLRRVNEFLTLALRKTIKFLSTCIRYAKKVLERAIPHIKAFLSTRNGKLIALIAVLILVLIIGFTRCSKEETPIPEAPIGTISSDILDVYKKPNSGSRILGQLPLDHEVEILEEKSTGGTTWGRIAEGWINMHYVQLDAE